MVKTFKKLTPILVVLIALFLSLCLPKTVAHAEEGVVLDYTRAMVYHSNGGIYVASRYKFPTEKVEFVTSEGVKEFGYDDIIPKIIALLKVNNVEYLYDEKTPNVLTVIEKHYKNRTEMNHDLGITGNEIDGPTPKDEGFWFTTYKSDNETYLKNGGKNTLETKWNNYATYFGITNFDVNKVSYNYVYGTEFKNVKTNGYVFYDSNDGMYYHSFYNIGEDTVISLRQKVPNTKNWYSVLIAASFGVLLCGVFVAKIVKKSGGTNGKNREETKSNAV